MKPKQAAKQYAILQRFPEPVLNNTTTNHLGNTVEPIEVFPPEIFFKGMSFNFFGRNRPFFKFKFLSLFRYRTKPKL